MIHYAYLFDVLIVLGSAVVAAAIFQRLNTSVVLGYLLAGIVIGKSGLNLVAQNETIEVMAEMGVVFLMFTVGLELPLQRLKTLRNQMLTQGLGQIAVTTVLLSIALYLLGLGAGQAILLGAALSLSSTALVLRLLSETRELSTRFGRRTVAILLTQDVAVAVMLVAVGFLGGASGMRAQDLAVYSLLLCAGIVGFMLLGRFLLRAFFTYIAARGSPEVFLTCTLFIVLASALLSESVGLSMGLGAFLAGMLLADTSYRHQVAADILPFRVLLLGLFFLTVGLSLDLGILVEKPATVAAYLIVLILLKAAVVLGIALAATNTLGEGLRQGLLLSQAGEFSLVLIVVGVQQSILTRDLAGVFAVTIALSMIVTPFLAMAGLALQGSRAVIAAGEAGRPSASEAPQEGHVVIAGFGRLGRNLALRLREEGTPFLAVDLNGHKVRRAERDAFPIVFGDATRPEILDTLHVETASALAVCLSDPPGSTRLVALVHYIFPDLKIVARAYDDAHAEELRQAGASEVISELAPTGQRFFTSLGRFNA